VFRTHALDGNIIICDFILQFIILQVLVFKQLLETRMQVMLQYQPDANYLSQLCDLHFQAPTDMTATHEHMALAFGSVKGMCCVCGQIHIYFVFVVLGGHMELIKAHQQQQQQQQQQPIAPIARPPSRARLVGPNGQGMCVCE
jgi:hypothetical protein